MTVISTAGAVAAITASNAAIHSGKYAGVGYFLGFVGVLLYCGFHTAFCCFRCWSNKRRIKRETRASRKYLS
jgi:hypothetical protein